MSVKTFRRSLAVLLAAALSLPAWGATFNIFGPATGILKGSATSPITTAATWSDVTVLLTGTCNSSVFVRGDGSCVAVSLTSGVSGTLPVANGGTNLTAATDDNVMVGNGTTWQSKTLTDCDSATSAVTYDVTTNAWGCNSITSISGAALTKTDDTNVTLTLGGSPTTALVNAASITAGWTGQLAASRGGTGVSSLGNLTKTDDTNVTLTLGGTPTGALITSTSITAGWAGTLAASRGGLGMSTVTDDTVAVANGTTWQSKAVPSCADSSGNHLNYDTATNAFSCGTTSSASTVSGANPSASVGLSAVNGVATTYLRSDGAPALSQSIVPTWSGVHTFSARSVHSDGITINDSARNVASLTDTALSFGNTTDNPTYTFNGTGVTTHGGNVTFSTAAANLVNFNSTAANGPYTTYQRSGATIGYVGDAAQLFGGASNDTLGVVAANELVLGTTSSTVRTTIANDGGLFMAGATGSSKGAGTVNATGVYVNGVSLSGGAQTTGTFTGTFTGFSGSPTCSFKYRLTGSTVFLFMNGGSGCTATSNAATFTITGLPSAIQPSQLVNGAVTSCQNNTLDSPCMGIINPGVSASTIIMSYFSANTGTGVITQSSGNWTSSGTKGINGGWQLTYDLGN